MIGMTNEKDNNLAIFEDHNIRRVYDKKSDTWFFSVIDVVGALTDSANPTDYIKKMRNRDKELSKGWGQIVTPLAINTKGGKQRVNCANAESLFRVIQSIPSPKAEPFKRWLAKVGYERIQEIADPEKSLNRARENWQKHGRSSQWIQQRMMGQEIRNKLTDYWKDHEIKEGKEYAALTNIIHQEWAGVSIKKHKDIKGLNNQNLRDHMSDAELVFTALAELSTRQVAEKTNATGMPENKKAAKIGGNIAKKARLELEDTTGKKVITSQNFSKQQKEIEDQK